MQGETKFATWMADLLGGASTRVARTAVDTIEPVGFTSQRLSADSERWLSPSGHAQLRPSGDVPLGTDPDSRSTPGPADKSASAADASLLDTRRLDEFRSVDDSSRSLTREVIGLFLVEAAVTLRDIDIALNTGDGCELARSTHTLKALADNVPPGIDFSNDPLLQGRLFSYLDTQLIRLGGPNFTQIPINAPKCPFHNLQRDGHMQTQVPRGRVNYEPSSLQGDTPRASQAQGTRHFSERPDDGAKGRVRPESFADHYSQARQFFISQSKPEQAHIASAYVFELSKVQTQHVREAVVGHLRHIDEGLAQRVANGLGLPELPPAPATAVPTQDLPPSPPLAILAKMKHTLEGRCVGILVADGSDGASVNKLRQAAMKEGASVKIVAPKPMVKMADGTMLAVDGQLAGTPSVVFDAVASVLEPNMGQQLASEAAAVDWFRDAFGHLKAIAACQGTQAILDAGSVPRDAGVFDPSDLKAFLEAARTRQWDREPKVRTLA